MPAQYTCPDCGTDNELHDGGGASSVVSIACWNCDSEFQVDRYRSKVMDSSNESTSVMSSCDEDIADDVRSGRTTKRNGLESESVR